MGFNIAGIVVNKNYENKIEELSEKLGFELSFQDEISYEEAVSNWKDDGICDIYFAENATILYLTMEMCGSEFNIESQNVLSFCYSETSMAFSFNYTENSQLQRSIMEYNGDIMNESGEPLPEEANSDTAGLIFAKITEILGKDFLGVDFESKAYRYSV
jgi:hypothetical protein